jgi:hypothetical protein
LVYVHRGIEGAENLRLPRRVNLNLRQPIVLHLNRVIRRVVQSLPHRIDCLLPKQLHLVPAKVVILSPRHARVFLLPNLTSLKEAVVLITLSLLWDIDQHRDGSDRSQLERLLRREVFTAEAAGLTRDRNLLLE